jgi:hypothetical protein
MSLEEYLEDLKRYIESEQDYFKRREELANKTIAKYDRTLQDKKAPSVEILRALVGKVVETQTIGRISSELVHFSYLHMLALHVQILQVNVSVAIVKLEESGAQQKKDLENLNKMKKKIEEFQQLLIEQYRKRQQAEENRRKDLLYVF